MLKEDRVENKLAKGWETKRKRLREYFPIIDQIIEGDTQEEIDKLAEKLHKEFDKKKQKEAKQEQPLETND